MKSEMHPTPTQTEWLQNNYQLYTNPLLAEKLGIPEHRLTLWLRLLGLRKRKGERKHAFYVYQPKKKVKPGIEKTIRRPKGDHTNISREEHVARILNIKL